MNRGPTLPRWVWQEQVGGPQEYEYRQVLMRLRQGDPAHEIALSGLMERAKAARFL